MVEYLEEFHDATSDFPPPTSSNCEQTEVNQIEVESVDNVSHEPDTAETHKQVNPVESTDTDTEVTHEQLGLEILDLLKDVETADNIMLETPVPTTQLNDVESTDNIPTEGSSNDTDEGDDDDNKPMSRKELLKLIGNLNANLVTRDEDYKKTVRDLHTEVSELRKELADLKDIPEKLSSHIRTTTEKFSQLNASNLLLENEIKLMKKQLYNTDTKTNTTTFRYPSYQTTDRLSSRVQVLENKLANQVTADPGKTTYSDETLDKKFQNVNLKLEGLTQSTGKIASDIYNLKAGSITSNPQIKSPADEIVTEESVTETHTVDCKLLMLFDSNGQYMKPEKMETESQYVRTAKIHNAISFLENCSVERVPEKILINVGLNNINDDEEDTSIDICEQYQRLIDVIKSRFKGSHIYISSILYRKDNKFSTVIGEVNKNLAMWETTIPSLSFVHHNNIKNDNDMMFDTKHLSRKGFFVMVTNFKYVLYRILPQQVRSTRKPMSKNNYHGGGGYSQQGGGRGRGGARGGGRGRGRGRGGH